MHKFLNRNLIVLLLVLSVPMLSCGDSSANKDSEGTGTQLTQEQIDTMTADTKVIALQAASAAVTSVPWNAVIAEIEKSKSNPDAVTKAPMTIFQDDAEGLAVQIDLFTGKIYIVMDGFSLLLGAGMYGTIVATTDLSYSTLTEGTLTVMLYNEQPIHMTKKWDDDTGLLDIPMDLAMNICVNFSNVLDIENLLLNPASACGLSGEISVTLNLPLGISIPITIPLFTGESTVCDDLQTIIGDISCTESGLSALSCNAFKTFFNGFIAATCN